MDSLQLLKEPDNPTNTLIITNIPSIVFESPTLTVFKNKIEAIATIQSWIPLKSFTRIIVTFFSVDNATRVRHQLERQNFLGKYLPVYWGESRSLVGNTANNHLEVPTLERNWLISPPGSPPVGWQGRREDPPNPETLHQEFLTALEHLVSSTSLEQSPIVSHQESRRTQVTLLSHDQQLLPKIIVHEDATSSIQTAEQNGVHGLERSRVSGVRTACPP